MTKPVLLPAEILLPDDDTDLSRWAVVACDQFTSEPAYWNEANTLVNDAPSTLRIILPEAHLETPGLEQRTAQTHEKMQEYEKNTLTKKVNGYVYVEREISPGVVRQGLVGCVDLEDYSYESNLPARIRPSENTVVERIPPRLDMRRGALLECPHILMLVDDHRATVVEPFAKKKQQLQLLYDTPLMMQGGKIRGWAITSPEDLDAIAKALFALEQEDFAKKYDVSNEQPIFSAAVGDGNHSLATAKAYWEEIKATLPQNQRENHPARFCLVELENIQSPANEIEPIHRVLFDVDPACLLRAAAMYAQEVGAKLLPAGQAEQEFTVLYANEVLHFSVQGAPHPLQAGTLEEFLAVFVQTHHCMRVDYVHGEDSVRLLVKQGAIGVLLPALKKEDLFRGVALGGVLPKKSFSLGHANQKRYYLECRKIQE